MPITHFPKLEPISPTVNPMKGTTKTETMIPARALLLNMGPESSALAVSPGKTATATKPIRNVRLTPITMVSIVRAAHRAQGDGLLVRQRAGGGAWPRAEIPLLSGAFGDAGCCIAATDAEPIGHPQCGQATARVEISRPHSGHGNSMVTLCLARAKLG